MVRLRPRALNGGHVLTAPDSDVDALFEAAYRGEFARLYSLLDADRSLVWEARGGLTALHLVAFRGDMEAAPLVVMKGATIDANGDAGTPLYQAVRSGHAAMAEYLLALGADANLTAAGAVTPLMAAALAGRDDLVRLLLTGGADPNARTTEGDCDLYPIAVPVCGESALHLAAAGGHTAAIGLLLAAGAERQGVDRLGQTPAHWAARHGRTEALALLQETTAPA